MLQSFPITLELKPQILTLLRTLKKPFSEQSWSNIFIYRNFLKSSFIQDNQHGFIRGISQDGSSFLMPLQHISDIEYLSHIAKQVFAESIYPIDESEWDLYRSQGFTIDYCSYYSDYMYEKASFKTLAGKTLAKKKNLYSQFVTKYEYTFRSLDTSHLEDAHVVLDTWYQDKPEAQENEREAMYEGLRFFDDLSLEGFLTYVENKPVGVYFGERQNIDTFVVHCAKTLPHIAGLSAFLHIESAKNLSDSIAHLNWEEDLGIGGLRQTKYSYAPALIRKKGRLIPSIVDYTKSEK